MKPIPAGGHIRTSLDNTWITPESILEPVRAYFRGAIAFDPASSGDNPTKAKRFCAAVPGTLFSGHPVDDGLFPSPEAEPVQVTGELVSEDGLEINWPVRGTFCNPPYGEHLNAWLNKFSAEAHEGKEIIALLPCSRWEGQPMHELLPHANAVCFHRGRVKFISSRDGQPCAGNPGANMLLGLNVSIVQWFESFSDLGCCLQITG